MKSIVIGIKATPKGKASAEELEEVRAKLAVLLGV